MHLVDILHFRKGRTTFVTSYLLSCTQSPSWKEVFSKKNQFLQKEIDLFSEERQIIKNVVFPESVSIPLKYLISVFISTINPCHAEVIWLAKFYKWAWHFKLFNVARVIYLFLCLNLQDKLQAV